MSDKVELSSIPVDAYLNYALSLTPKETELVKKFSKWLPNEIVDAHAHSNTQNQCGPIDNSFLSSVITTFPWFEIEKHTKVNQVLYPRSTIKMLLFPNPYQGINHRTANEYIVRQATERDWILPILCGFPDDIEYTTAKLRTQKFYGLKMYPAYFSPPAQKIGEYFPDQVLKYCENLSYPIILHLPQSVVRCRKELISIAKEFPDLKIVLAHMGLEYLKVKGLKKAFSLLSEYQNIFLDTAMVTSVEVFKMAFDILGYHKIIFGTDQPLNLIRGRMYKNPTLGARIATGYHYHWADLKEQREFSRHAKNAILFHCEILHALQKTIWSCEENKDIKNCIFRKNAERVFGLS